MLTIPPMSKDIESIENTLHITQLLNTECIVNIVQHLGKFQIKT